MVPCILQVRILCPGEHGKQVETSPDSRSKNPWKSGLKSFGWNHMHPGGGLVTVEDNLEQEGGHSIGLESIL